MHGSTALTLAVLCLGLCWGQRDQEYMGTLSKPSIWADPGPKINMGTRVTIWCQGSQQTDGYRLYKEGSFLRPMTLLNPRDTRGHVSIPFVDTHDAGQYQCAHQNSSGSSELSDPLFLTVTGVYTIAQTSLSARPSSVVASGGHVDLWCRSQYTVDTLYLLKEGGADPPWKMKPKHSADWFEALFPLGPVNSSHGGPYSCYGSYVSSIRVWLRPSDPLDLQVTGLYAKPSLSALPDSLVLPGDSLTLTCGSETGFHSFALTRDEPPLHLPYILRSQQSPNFTLSPVNRSTAGQYRCYHGGHDRYLWSAPSDPMDILVAGCLEKPSLLAHPGPTVTAGENVTLQCHSEGPMDTFHLFKEGHTGPLQRRHVLESFQVNFTLGAVTSAHRGTYRCYSSHSTSPYLLSHPSDPLELVVTGSSEDQAPTVLRSKALTGLPMYQKVLLGDLGIHVLLLFFLFLLLLFIQHKRQRKDSK